MKEISIKYLNKLIPDILFTVSDVQRDGNLIIHSNKSIESKKFKKSLDNNNIKYRCYGNDDFEIIYINMNYLIEKMRDDKINKILNIE